MVAGEERGVLPPPELKLPRLRRGRVTRRITSQMSRLRSTWQKHCRWSSSRRFTTCDRC